MMGIRRFKSDKTKPELCHTNGRPSGRPKIYFGTAAFPCPEDTGSFVIINEGC